MYHIFKGNLTLISVTALLLLCSCKAPNASNNISATTIKTPSGASITNYKASGSLESTNPLGCISLNQAKNQYTAADLYPAAAQCIKEERYNESVELFMLAGAYSYFDTLRVADRTAHQGAKILILNNFGTVTPEKKKIWSDKLNQLAKNKQELRIVCNKIEKIGIPNYFPTYMIQHGIKAFTPNPENKPIVENFNPKTAWETTLDKYLHCPN